MISDRKRATRALTGLAAAVAVAAGLAGCAGSSSSTSPAAAQALTVAIAAVAPPFSGSTQAIDSMRITSNIFDPLIFKDPRTGDLTPGLATAWKQVSPTVTDLTVRQGVEFHDGTPMTADDVAFTLSPDRLGPNGIEPSALASTVSKVEVVAPDTVEITTAQPDPALLDRLASPIGYVVPRAYLQKVGLQQFGVDPIGTGPYKVQSVTPGESVDLIANPHYWGPKPTYTSVSFDQVPDVTARVSGVATGKYDIATSIPPDQSEQVTRNGQQVVSTTVNNVVELGFMTNQADRPTTDPKVRQAMQLAIDRQGIAESLWRGQATVPDGFNLPAYAGFYDSGIRVVKQDVEQARALLTSAGYSGQPIVLQYIGNYYPNLDLALQAMLPMWNSVGLNVVLEPVANFTMLDYAKLQVYATSSNLQLGDDPVSPIFSDWLSPSGIFVKSGRYTPSAEMTAAGQTLATSTSEADRRSAFATVARLWTTEVPSISLWQPVEITALAAGVSFTPDPRYWMRFAPVPGT
jgi:peptide/nickel transport system substrate-binding protein